MDMTVSGNTQKLHRIDVMYPDDTDMNEVRKNMEQSFGKTTDKVTDFDMIGTLLDSDMQRYDYEGQIKRSVMSFQRDRKKNMRNYGKFL